MTCSNQICHFYALCVCQVEGVGSTLSLSQPLVTAWPGSVMTALSLWWTALRLPGIVISMHIEKSLQL